MEMDEREALAFSIGMLTGHRDRPGERPSMVAFCRAAVEALLPRARELGLDLDADGYMPTSVRPGRSQ